MKIFVTGAGGFIGNAIMKCGLERGHEMKGCDLKANSELNIVEGNITNLEMLKRETEGFDAIIHAACVHGAHLDNGMSFEEFYHINISGSNNIFQSAVHNGIKRVVFSSSLDIHCGANWDLSGIQRYTKDTPDIPNSHYALMKKMIEEMGHFYYRTKGVEFCAERYVFVVGSIEDCSNIRPIQLTSRVLLVEDCAEANVLACESDRVLDDVILIGPDVPFTNEDLVASLTDRDAVLEKYWPGCIDLLKKHGLKTKGVLWPICDLSVAKQLLGWKPRYGFEWYLNRLKNS